MYYWTYFRSLQNITTGREIYIQAQHNTALREVIEVLKTFIVNLKDTVPISAKSSIKFVRKGAKVTRKRTPPVGILHHASQWILLADLNKNCCFLVHIAFTQLRPGITIF